jgi:hypothetical protein
MIPFSMGIQARLGGKFTATSLTLESFSVHSFKEIGGIFSIVPQIGWHVIKHCCRMISRYVILQ